MLVNDIDEKNVHVEVALEKVVKKNLALDNAKRKGDKRLTLISFSFNLYTNRLYLLLQFPKKRLLKRNLQQRAISSPEY
ncbi:hypothetical protein MUB16_33835 [Priestia sp. OVL9]|nr:hypothetical protein [Priestia sp. OVL9]